MSGSSASKPEPTLRRASEEAARLGVTLIDTASGTACCPGDGFRAMPAWLAEAAGASPDQSKAGAEDPDSGLVVHRFRYEGKAWAAITATSAATSQKLEAAGLPSGPGWASREQAAATASLLADQLLAESALEQSDSDMTSLADEIGRSYETLTFLYQLGRQMIDVRRPTEFAERALAGLMDLLRFGWGAVDLAGDWTTHEAGDDGPTQPVVMTEPGTDAAHASGVLARIRGTDLTPGRDVREQPGGGDEVLVQSIVAGDRQAGIIVLGKKMNEAGEPDQITSVDTQAVEAVSGFLGSTLEAARLYGEQERSLLGSLNALTGTLDAKDRYTQGHSERVALLAELIAQAAGLPQEEIETARLSGRLHDIGKIGVPDRVLCKPGRLTDEEFGEIKQHPEIGHRILRDMPALADALPGVLHHHERWDGRGYPHGLAGEDIPVIARILAVADTFDAMSSNRSYRTARDRAEVLAEIARVGGQQLDPELAAVFVTLDLTPYDELMARHRDSHTSDQRIERAA